VRSSAAHRRFPRAALLRVASDERLVELVRGGSEAAFEAIYDRHHRGMLAFCRHMLSSAEEGEDALQHTFMAAYRHLTGGDAEIQLRPWLYAIARNRCLTMLRARRERPLEECDTPATEHLSAEAQRRQDVRDLLADVARLPEDQRAALVLAELGAVSHDEIAIVLSVPRQKVKALVFQARTSLAASRKARETPCEEIREQVANLRGGALRRTTLHRHLRECAGCRAFRDEVALQRRMLAVALPVIPTVGLKQAALGAAFGSGSGGGGAAVSASGALAAKALVTVAIVGGGTTAGVQAARHAVPAPPAVERSAPARHAARAATAVRQVSRHVSAAAPTLPRAAGRRGLAPARKARPAAPSKAVAAPAKPAAAPVGPVPAAPQRQPAPGAKPAKTPPGQTKKAAPGAEPAKPAKTPPGQAKKGSPRAQPPGQAKKTDPAAKPAKPAKTPPGQAKKALPAAPKPLPPGQAKQQPAPLAGQPPKVHGKHG
jgi:RNA polymerase sigma factor (sigma-70 family)